MNFKPVPVPANIAANYRQQAEQNERWQVQDTHDHAIPDPRWCGLANGFARSFESNWGKLFPMSNYARRFEGARTIPGRRNVSDQCHDGDECKESGEKAQRSHEAKVSCAIL